ncbi:MAG: translation elongation factor Ts [Pseudomonadota bacterium]
MTEISATLVKELREKSGAGMLDCKKALTETKGDVEAAMDHLRKKGLATATKKSGRTVAEGLIGVASRGNAAVVIELNAETDFVARNEHFQNFLAQITDLALRDKIGTIEELKAASLDGGTVEAALTALIATIGENMALRRMQLLMVGQGVVATYVHNAAAPNRGKIGVLAAIESSGSVERLSALGRQLAMHIAAARPESLDVASLSKDTVARERSVYADKARQSGKPAEIVEKMVEGSLRKFYEQAVLLEQTFVVDGESKISSVLEKVGREVGSSVKIAGFIRYELGEGVEKKAGDFASEVAKMAAG